MKPPKFTPEQLQSYVQNTGRDMTGLEQQLASTLLNVFEAVQIEAPGFSEFSAIQKQTRLTDACIGLNKIVEGVRCERWANAQKFRLKDTPEWVEFYLALSEVRAEGATLVRS